MVRQSEIKGELHPRNPHRGSYDFDALIAAHPPLKPFVGLNKYGTRSVNFFDPEAVRTLNAALLALHYDISWWEISPLVLTPPIPGRADYIHYVADLIGAGAGVGESSVRCLDVGVGATCIYPIIGRSAYGWEFVGCDISESSLESSRRIVENNEGLSGAVELRYQPSAENIFEGVILPGEQFTMTICNPPFHDSLSSAQRGSRRKQRNLGGTVKGAKSGSVVLNFSGQSNELWCEGGERLFVERMILQSRQFARQCRWFTSLISNEDNLKPLRGALARVGASEVRVIEMSQGNKRSRILAWRFY